MVLVDTSFAQHFLARTATLLGRRVGLDAIPGANPRMPRWRTIVGVIGHVKHYSLDVEGREQIYVPHAQPLFGTFIPRHMTLTVSTLLDPASVRNQRDPCRRVLAIDKDLPLYNIATMDQLISNSRLHNRG